MKTATKSFASFVLAFIISLFCVTGCITLMAAPTVEIPTEQVTEQVETKQPTECFHTVIPAIPSSVLEMLTPYRAEILTIWFSKTQELFDQLEEVGSPDNYCTTKQKMINIQKFYTTRIWSNFFLEDSANKDKFIELLETEVYSKM